METLLYRAATSYTACDVQTLSFLSAMCDTVHVCTAPLYIYVEAIFVSDAAMSATCKQSLAAPCEISAGVRASGCADGKNEAVWFYNTFTRPMSSVLKWQEWSLVIRVKGLMDVCEVGLCAGWTLKDFSCQVSDVGRPDSQDYIHGCCPFYREGEVVERRRIQSMPMPGYPSFALR